jgi:hypothetical protein
VAGWWKARFGEFDGISVASDVGVLMQCDKMLFGSALLQVTDTWRSHSENPKTHKK